MAVSTSASTWTLSPASGDLQIRTGVAGPAAKMGHRLTIGVGTWEAGVQWQAGDPVSADLVVQVDSIQVLKGEGGVTPLTGPEKSVARSNALKSLDAKKFPQIRFTTSDIVKTADGYRMTGSLEIHGTARPQVVDVAVEDRGETWALSAQVPVTQTEFGVKPYSLLMGSMRVADEVTVVFTGTHPK